MCASLPLSNVRSSMQGEGAFHFFLWANMMCTHTHSLFQFFGRRSNYLLNCRIFILPIEKHGKKKCASTARLKHGEKWHSWWWSQIFLQKQFCCGWLGVQSTCLVSLFQLAVFNRFILRRRLSTVKKRHSSLRKGSGRYQRRRSNFNAYNYWCACYLS